MVGGMGSDQSSTTGICLLEPWVTMPYPPAGQKLELDPVARWEAAGPALPFHWPVASPGLVGRKGIEQSGGDRYFLS